MSTPAPVVDARAARPTRPPSPTTTAAERPRRRLRPAVVLPILFIAAAAYHAIWGALHVTPAIFTDELLHSKLAQAFASGHPFEIRGERVFFPALLPALLEAPAWLAGSTATAYEIVKATNAVVMSSVVFPAYWLARQLVRPSYALLAAAAAVAAPALVYHSYLLSEALAYPVFVLAVAIYVRTLARPSARWDAAALAVSAAAVATRMQFVVLPLVFLLVVAARPRELRRHLVTIVGLLTLGLIGLAAGTTVLGTYSGLALLDFDPAAVARWAGWTAVLVPFSAGWILVPGALVGLGVTARRPRSRGEGAFARLTLGVAALVLLEAGFVAAGDSSRPLERYAIYLAPLVAVAFFSWVERGAPHGRAAVGLALALGTAAWLVPFSTLADYRFSFDSPVLSAFGELAHLAGTANAATVFALVPLALSVAFAVRLRPHAAGALAVLVLLATGFAAYAGDTAMTERARTAWAGHPSNWLDRGGWGEADFLALPGGSPHFAWATEAWNRDLRRPIWLDVGRPANDAWAGSSAEIADDGTLVVDGTPARAGLLVVNDFATQVEFAGATTLAHPRPGLTVVRVPAAPKLRAYARGLYHDGLASGSLTYRTWPQSSSGGVYRAKVALPATLRPRALTFSVEGGASRSVHLEPGRSVAVELPADEARHALRITSDRSESIDDRTANPRLVAFRVLELSFVPRGL